MERIEYDIELIYLDAAKSIFPEISDCLEVLDITSGKPQKADISVMSATLEHLQSISPGLDNVLESTSELIILRTFMGEYSNKAIGYKEGANTYYWINQYSFLEICEIFLKHGFSTKIVRDRYTDSIPQYIRNGIIRTQYIIIGKK